MLKSLRSYAHRRLCALIRTTRKSAGLTQAKLAERLGVPQSVVAKIEGGERRIDVIEFLELARALKVDPCALIRSIAPKR